MFRQAIMFLFVSRVLLSSARISGLLPLLSASLFALPAVPLLLSAAASFSASQPSLFCALFHFFPSLVPQKYLPSVNQLSNISRRRKEKKISF